MMSVPRPHNSTRQCPYQALLLHDLTPALVATSHGGVEAGHQHGFLKLFILGCLLFGMVGCSYFQQGDGSSADSKHEKSEAESKAPPFEPARIAILPAGIPRESTPLAERPTRDTDRLDDTNGLFDDSAPSAVDIGGLLHVVVKPGHHVVTRHELRSNEDDVVAILENACVDRNSIPMTLPNLSMALGVEQQVSLPRNQTRQFDVPMYMPIAQDGRKFLQISSRLKDRTTGRTLMMEGHALSSLRAEQYHILVLTEFPEKFSFLRLLPCVTPPRRLENSTELPWDFVVQRPNLQDRITLPGNASMLTSTAYIFWDGVEPDRLTSSQSMALIDWLHWGGQLIVNGVRSLDALRGSYLEPYLPAIDYRPKELTALSLDRINEQWSQLSESAAQNKEKFALIARTPGESQSLELILREGSQMVPETEGLLAERRVGRGRVVVSGFDLGGSLFVRWPGYDGFMNSCILRRPAREFAAGSDLEVGVYYRGTTDPYGSAPDNTQLRVFARDATDGRALDSGDGAIPEQLSPNALGFSVDPVGGIGAWSDFSLPPQLVRESLQEASGLRIPKAGTIATMIGAYLICLVPVNWLVFRSLGRVEWAWFAAPVLSVLGAITVARLAQLDVGFVRSQTDFAILELQPAYSRAHATRFTSLYSSLTTNYRCKGGSSSSNLVVVPMADDIRRSTRRMEGIQMVRQRQESPMETTGFRVLSNSSGLLRSEEYVDLGGGLEIQSMSDLHIQLRNKTKLRLQGICLMIRDETGFLMGEITQVVAPHEEFKIPLTRKSSNWKRDLRFAVARRPNSEAMEGDIDLTSLRDLALDPQRALIGECRLVAWTDELISTLEIAPIASQRKAATLLVANLAYAKWQAPTPDLSSTAEIYEQILRSAEEDLMGDELMEETLKEAEFPEQDQ